MVESILIGILVSSGIVILDQASKFFMMWYLGNNGGTVGIIDNFFSFDLTFNTGASFSLFAGRFWLLMLVTVVATIIFIFMAKYARFERGAKWYFFGIYFMIGGMIGNFIDRAFATDRGLIFGVMADKHGVCDFIHFHFFPAIFNIADCFLCIGVVLVLIDLIFFERKRNKDGKFQSE